MNALDDMMTRDAEDQLQPVQRRQATAHLAACVPVVVERLGAEILEADDLGCYAVELAMSGWAVLPLRGKVPAIPKRRGGNGVLDATTDLMQVITWWAGAYQDANIGVRIPPSLAVIDIDPRQG